MGKKIFIGLLIGLVFAPVYTWAQDGLADLLVYRPALGGYTWMWQNLAETAGYNLGDFGFAGRWTGAIAEPNDTPIAGDINGDGYADILIMRDGNGISGDLNQYDQVWLLTSNGSSFAWGGRIMNGSIWEDNDIWSLGDFNGDGLADILQTRDGNGISGDPNQWDQVWLYKSTGSNFEYVRRLMMGAIWGDPNRLRLAGDVNGDGYADLIIAERGAVGSQRVWHTWSWLFDGSDFYAQVYRRFVLGGDTNTLDDSLLTADFNGDGYADLAAYDSSLGALVWGGINDGATISFSASIWVGGGIMEPTDLLLAGDFTPRICIEGYDALLSACIAGREIVMRTPGWDQPRNNGQGKGEGVKLNMPLIAHTASDYVDRLDICNEADRDELHSCIVSYFASGGKSKHFGEE